jgi:hypothetical protein
MTTHFSVLVLFAASVAIVFGTLGRDEGRAQRALGVRVFSSLVAGAYLVGWLMLALIR